METTQRKGARGWREQLLTLLNGWDPARQLAAGGPRNEYEWLVDGLLVLLSRHAGEEEIDRFLETEISGRFGTKPQGVAQFVTKAVNWFRITSTEE